MVAGVTFRSCADAGVMFVTFTLSFVVTEATSSFTETYILFSCPFGSWVSLWNFETIRGSLIRPRLAGLAQKICTL